jgi:hypothetical protein
MTAKAEVTPPLRFDFPHGQMLALDAGMPHGISDLRPTPLSCAAGRYISVETSSNIARLPVNRDANVWTSIFNRLRIVFVSISPSHAIRREREKMTLRRTASFNCSYKRALSEAESPCEKTVDGSRDPCDRLAIRSLFCITAPMSLSTLLARPDMLARISNGDSDREISEQYHHDRHLVRELHFTRANPVCRPPTPSTDEHSQKGQTRRVCRD